MTHFKQFKLTRISVLGSVCVSSLLWITGCNVGPDYIRPLLPIPKTYTSTPLPKKTVKASKTGAGKAQQFQLGKAIPAQWWTLFHSPVLNQLMTQGLSNSPTVTAAQAALRQAQENLKVAIATGLFPSIAAQATADREQFSGSTFGSPAVNLFNLYTTSVNVSYNLDLWGAQRRYREFLRAQIDYQRFELEAAYLTLSANIVTTAVIEASLRAQVEATQSLIASQENQLDIVKKQFRLGSISQADVLAQEAQLATTRANLPPLLKNQQQYRNALAVLVGKSPSHALPTLILDSLTLPARLPLSLPSQLVDQRPDVRAAEASLHQASANVGIAAANRLPQVNLHASYGYSSNQIRDIFVPEQVFWDIGTQLTQPIFDAGALKAKQRLAVAVYDQAVAEYKQTVLKAFQNVADTLYAIENDAKALKAQSAAESAAFKLNKLVDRQYKLGAVSYLELLNAERQYQLARISRIQAEAARYADTAALFQALGGGWWKQA